MTIGVIILCRNEAASIIPCLNAVLSQTPDKVVVINDGSTDNSRNILSEYENIIDIIDYPIIHDSWVISPKLSMVINTGFDHLPKYYDHYMILGGDHVIASYYIKNLIKLMKEYNVSIASGVIKSENNDVRGSGRIISRQVLQSQNFEYKVNYGYETYLLFRAIKDGFKVKVFPISSGITTRKTKTNYSAEECYIRGISYRCLGFSLPYSTLSAIKSYRNIKQLGKFLKGYFTCKKNWYYEKDLRKNTIHYEIKKIFKCKPYT